MRNGQKGNIFRTVQSQVSPSTSTVDPSSLRTWCATYPPKGGAEALATVTERCGLFEVSVTAVGWALEGRERATRATGPSLEATFEAAQARADTLAAEVLGREVFARWNETAARGL
jgi:hypothetical protein